MPSGRAWIEDTRPTGTPSILTLASGSITRPARGETTVSGTVWAKSPRNNPVATATISARAATVASPASGRIARFMGRSRRGRGRAGPAPGALRFEVPPA